MTETRGAGDAGPASDEHEPEVPEVPERRADASLDATFDLASLHRVAGAAPGFVAGTMLATPDGARPVETLAAGDRVATSTGGVATLRAVRHLHVDDDRAAGEAWPIRIAAHAFSEGRPARDMVLAPGSRLRVDFLGEMLVPLAALVDAVAIAQDEVEHADYHVLELDAAAAVLAEELAVEAGSAEGERPPAYESGPMIEALRLRLAARLDTSGWTLEATPFGDMHLLVDGERVDMRKAGLAACAMIPVTARNVWLVSQAATPSTVIGSLDHRLLGLPLAALSIDDGLSPRRAIARDDPRLCVGFHVPEPGLRWTTGRARLPASLWQGCEGYVFVRVDLAEPPLPRWVRPPAETEPASP